MNSFYKIHFVQYVADLFAKHKSAVFSTSCRKILGFISSKAFIFDAESIYVGLEHLQFFLLDLQYFDRVQSITAPSMSFTQIFI